MACSQNVSCSPHSTLAKTGGSKTRAAQLLGMTLRQLRYRVKKLGLQSSRAPAAPDDSDA